MVLFSIINYQLSINLCTFAPTFKKSKHWRDGRVVDYSSLENYRTERNPSLSANYAENQ